MLPALTANPKWLGNSLRFELEGRWAARRGPYRIIYALDAQARTVEVLAVAHRMDVYRRPEQRRLTFCDGALRLGGDALPVQRERTSTVWLYRLAGAPAVAATMGVVTTREKVERLLDRLSEAQLEAEYRRLQQAVQGKRAIDDWGDLDRFSARASLGVLRHLDEEEAKVGFSWEEHRPT